MASQAEDDTRRAADPSLEDDVIDEVIAVGVLHSEGDVIAGRYRLGSLLGRGGMGDVWCAHDETLEIDIALKLIRPEEGAEDSEDRLLREARIAAKLGHPAIVRISDFGRSELDEPFIVMELLDGADLATAMKSHGTFNPIKAVRIILPILHALAAAHGKGIVHRDVKPDNIFLAKLDGDQFQPKIVDFGIAKLDRSNVTRLTRTGALLGSPTYMSPEQGRGDEVDQRADLWSLCIVLFEMIAGYPPFEAKNAHALLYAIMVGDPKTLPVRSADDEALWQIIRRGLEKDADDRWSSARDLGVALAEWLVAQGVTEDITGATIESTWGERASVFDSIGPPTASESLAKDSHGVTARDLSAQFRASPRRRLVLGGIAVTVFFVGLGAAIGFSSNAASDAESASAGPSAAPAPGLSAEAVLETKDEASEQIESPAPTASVLAVEDLPTAPAESAAAPDPKPAPKPRRVWRPRPKTRPDPKPKMKNPFQ